MKYMPLSMFIKQQKEFIEIDDSEEYLRVRVKLHQQGMVVRDRVKGIEIRTKKQQVCKKNQLLVAEIDAKVGGYGLVPQSLQGAIVSSHYYLFNIDETQLSVEYLKYILQTKQFFSQIRAQGSTNYASIRPKDVLEIKIPYTSINEQKKIVSLMQLCDQLESQIKETQKNYDALRKAVLKEAFEVEA